MAPAKVPSTTPQPKPATTRSKVTVACRCSSPVAARSAKVEKITDGGGTRRPLARPVRTMISHATASATGTSNPSAGRRRRPAPGRRAMPCGLIDPSELNISNVDIVQGLMTWKRQPGLMRDRARGANGRLSSLVAGGDELIVDQGIDACLHVDVGRHHAGLLQGEPGCQDRVALRGADAAVCQFGA